MIWGDKQQKTKEILSKTNALGSRSLKNQRKPKQNQCFGEPELEKPKKTKAKLMFWGAGA